MTYAEGKRVEIDYAEIVGVSDLNYYEERSYSESPMHSYSRDVFVSKYKLEGDSHYSFDIGAWNGFWDVRTLSDVSTLRQDTAIIAGDDWVALQHHRVEGSDTLSTMIVFHWQGGAWTRDTVVLPEYFRSGVSMKAGNDFIVALARQGDSIVTAGYFIKKTPGGWRDFPINIKYADHPNRRKLSSITTGIDLFAIEFHAYNTAGDSYLGRWVEFFDYVPGSSGDSPVGDSLFHWSSVNYYGGLYPFKLDLMYTVGLDYVAFGMKGTSNIVIEVASDTGWTGYWDYQTVHNTGGDLKQLASLESGIVYMTDGTSAKVAVLPRDHVDCFTTEFSSPITAPNIRLYPAGGNKFAVRTGYSVKMYDWAGTGLDVSTICTMPTGWAIQVAASEEICAVWSKHGGTLVARRHLGGNTWSDLDTLTTGLWIWKQNLSLHHFSEMDYFDFDAAGGVVACAGTQDSGVFHPRQALFGWNARLREWDTKWIGGLYAGMNVKLDTVIYGPFDRWRFPAYNKWSAYNGRVYLDMPGNGLAAFQYHRGEWVSQPGLTVVDKVRVLPEGANSRDTIVTEYEYGGGILDESSSTPRFARTTVSSPFFIGETEDSRVYSTSCFYNDLDDDIDTSRFNTAKLVLPDLEDTAFHVPKGGYMLDGTAYLSFVDTVLPTIDGYLDSTDNYTDPRLEQTRSSVFLQEYSTHDDASPRVLVSAVTSVSDGLTSSVSYSYDEHGRVVEARKPLWDNLVQVDVTSYADFGGFPNLPGDHVELSKSFILDGTDTVRWLGRLRNQWDTRTKKGRIYRWRDPADPTTEECTRDVDSSTSRGVARVWKDVEGRVVKVVFDGDQHYQVASMVHADGQGVFLFDAETGDDVSGIGWGEWNSLAGTSGVIVDSMVFSGRYSFEVTGVQGQQYTECLHLKVDTQHLSDASYSLSYWVKSDCTPYSQVVSYVGGSARDTLYKEVTAAATWDSWSNIRLPISGDFCNGADSVVVSLGFYNIYSDNVVAYFDDVRLVPAAASVATSVYDRATGLLLSKSGADNVPVSYEYDSFNRLTRTTNHLGQTLSEKSRHYSRDDIIDLYSETDLGSDSVTFSSDVWNPFFYDLSYERIDTSADYSAQMVCGADTVVLEGSDPNIRSGRVFGFLNPGGTMPLVPVTTVMELKTESVGGLGVVKAEAYRMEDGYVSKEYHDDVAGSPWYIPVTKGQWLYYKLGYERDVPTQSPNVSLSISTPDTAVAFSCTDCPDTSYWTTGHIWIDSGQMATISLYGYRADAYVKFVGVQDRNSVSPPRKTFDIESPNYVKATSYMADTDGVTSVQYADGMDRLMQARTSAVNDQTNAIVSGVADRDARGRVTKSYLPYEDVVGSNGAMDITDRDNILTEAIAYYDGTHAVDMDGVPYSESEYDFSDVKQTLRRTSGPSPTYALGSGHTSEFERDLAVIGNDTLLVATSYDADSIRTVTKQHVRGEYSKKVSHFKVGSIMDSTTTISYVDPVLAHSRTCIDTAHTGSSEITLRETWTNNDGSVDSTYAVDLGKTRMFYDKAGRTRFVQTDLQAERGEFTYNKYDLLGRLIEQGLCDVQEQFIVYFGEYFASLERFPLPGHPIDVQYRWFYDVYDTVSAPGKLLRVESGDQSYYKNFYYYPQQFEDLMEVKLPSFGSAVKAVRHKYARNGSLESLVVYPYWSVDTTAGRRCFEYVYDDLGRLKGIDNESDDSHPLKTLRHAEYSYNVTGAITSTLLGISDDEYVIPAVHDTVQKVDYIYDPLGRLIGINDSDIDNSVVTSYDSLGVENGNDNDHFGECLVLHDSTGGYFNGRLYKMASTSSSRKSAVQHKYEYRIDDRGWLTNATHDNDDRYTRKYAYNKFGMRHSETKGQFGIPETYSYATSPGSARLLSTSSMPTGVELTYDACGNMTSDLSRNIFAMTYDFRNLLDTVNMVSEAWPSASDQLIMTYDQGGQRIKKQYFYHYMDACDTLPPTGDTLILDGPGGLMGTMSMMSSGDCPYPDSSETLYLYDNGVLLATFDENDDVLELFVNGPSGRVASYKYNDDNSLHYHLNDHLGSARVLIHALDGAAPRVKEYFHYHPYGEILTQSGTHPTSFQFSGKERDDHSSFGLDYFGARYYDASRGSFSSVDMAGQFAGGYCYVGNNPLQNIDPDGNFAVGLFVSGLINAAGLYMTVKGLNDMGENMCDMSRSDMRKSFALRVAGAVIGANISNPVHQAGANLAAASIIDRDNMAAHFRGFAIDLGRQAVMSWAYKDIMRRMRTDLRKFRNGLGANSGFDFNGVPGEGEYQRGPMWTDWYKMPNKDLEYFEDNADGEAAGGEYFAEVLVDAKGEVVDPEVQSVITDASRAYNMYVCDCISQDPNMGMGELKATFGDRAPCDIKTQAPFKTDRYYRVHGEVYLSQDLGNLVFGAYAEGHKWGLSTMKFGGGVVQFGSDLKRSSPWGLTVPAYPWAYATARWFGNFRTWGDDTRGAYFVNRGALQRDEYNRLGTVPR